jgi:hypothetical protein
MHALQRMQRDPCDQLPQVRVQTPSPEEQGKKGVTNPPVFSSFQIV